MKNDRLKSWLSGRLSKAPGSNLLLTTGMVLSAIIVAPFAIDIPMYYNVQQQLQTAVDAGALAGASKLPFGQAAAKQAAYEFASKNLVAGRTLQPSELTYNFTTTSMEVSSQVQINTITAPILCGLQITLKDKDMQKYNKKAGATVVNCDDMTVGAKAKAIPATRDTMLVIDTSGSMDDLGCGHPFIDVKAAANKYLDELMINSYKTDDKVGLVNFGPTGKLDIVLTSKSTSPNFSSVRSAISKLALSGRTNYEPGLRLALDEIQAHGRTSATKQIVFLTDGMPNLPAPPSYLSYNSSSPEKKCENIVNNSTQVKALCTKNKKGQIVCPVLPNPIITDSMISSAATQCINDFITYMDAQTMTQINRANTLGVSIYTISIRDDNTDGILDIFRRLRKEPTWLSSLLDDMSDTTNGQAYSAPKYDAVGIQTIYTKIAQEIRMKLTS